VQGGSTSQTSALEVLRILSRLDATIEHVFASHDAFERHKEFILFFRKDALLVCGWVLFVVLATCTGEAVRQGQLIFLVRFEGLTADGESDGKRQ
jgi:hypothetical protein